MRISGIKSLKKKTKIMINVVHDNVMRRNSRRDRASSEKRENLSKTVSKYPV